MNFANNKIRILNLEDEFTDAERTARRRAQKVLFYLPELAHPGFLIPFSNQ